MAKSIMIGKTEIGIEEIPSIEKAILALRNRQAKTAERRANKPVAAAREPRVLPTTVVTLVGVNRILPSVKDGDHGFQGWTNQFRFTTDLVKQLKAAGVRLIGNYHDATWAGVVDGEVLTITGVPPTGKKPTGPRKAKVEVAIAA